jgi:hypothetical protein
MPARLAHMFGMERNILFKCPRTGMNVQHWFAGTLSDAPDTHVSVRCPSCASLHFVNVTTGRMLSEAAGQPPRYSPDEACSRMARHALASSES